MPTIFRDSFESILSKAGDYLSLEELELVRRAYQFTVESLKRDKFIRFSGDPAIIHPLAVAELLVDWHMDAPTIAAGFLHDTIEDPNIHPLQLRATFKEHVTALVDGVTKLKKFEVPDDTDANTAYYYKVFLAVAEDIRVALIKIADRLHNLRTLRYLPGYKRIKKAHETMNIFVPLTSFLGMDAVRDEMEDISFEYIQPVEFENTIDFLNSVIEQEDEFFTEVMARINLELRRLKMPQYVRKFTYSIKEANRIMKMDGPPYPKTGLVEITVPSEEDCYQALRAVHRCFQTLSSGFQDTIPFPSIDLKRMIETNVLHASGRPFIVRIVSFEMKRVNRWGILPYLAAPHELERMDFLMERVREIGDIVEKMKEEKDLMGHESLVNIITSDLLQKNIFVVTADGRQVELPAGSTVLDFAYKMGRDIGNHYVGACINSRSAGMDEEPEKCDALLIETREEATPQISWLAKVKTPSAKRYIRRQLGRQTREQAENGGRDELLKWFGAAGLASSGDLGEMERLLFPVVDFLELQDIEAFYQKIGYGEILVEDAVNAMREQFKRIAFISRAELEPVISGKQTFSRAYLSDIIEADRSIRGNIYTCEYCSAVPGDAIEVSTAGRKTVIHKKNCKRTGRGFGKMRAFNARWKDTRGIFFPARLKVKAFPGEEPYINILGIIDANEARLMSSERNMQSPDGLELMEFMLEVRNSSDIDNICSSILNLKDAVVATRI